jgi:hypothetical protein
MQAWLNSGWQARSPGVVFFFAQGVEFLLAKVLATWVRPHAPVDVFVRERRSCFWLKSKS